MRRILQTLLSMPIPKRLRLPLAFHCNFARQWRAELNQLKRWRCLNARAVDIGANEGLYSYQFAHWFGIVEAFEPNAAAVQLLRQYESSRINIYEVALSASRGEGNLYVPVSVGGREEVGWGTLEPKMLESSQRRIKRVLKSTLDSYSFDRVNVVKIDVEGHECEVLAGAINTLERCRPVVLLEPRRTSLGFVEEFFKPLHYSLSFWNSTRLVKWQGEPSSVWGHAYEDIFAIPQEKSQGLF